MYVAIGSNGRLSLREPYIGITSLYTSRNLPLTLKAVVTLFHPYLLVYSWHNNMEYVEFDDATIVREDWAFKLSISIYRPLTWRSLVVNKKKDRLGQKVRE